MDCFVRYRPEADVDALGDAIEDGFVEAGRLEVGQVIELDVEGRADRPGVLVDHELSELVVGIETHFGWHGVEVQGVAGTDFEPLLDQAPGRPFSYLHLDLDLDVDLG
ncbi:uncharacterized protein METZ01_LOCUS470228 [marine metagenome]|uniref:Uncharacterized protein n=1 Tax=marine metagenome TaxID=408172 RepID=A0A383BBX5_9ZZZZ